MAPLSDRETLQSLRARQSHDYRNSIRHWDVMCQAICLSISTILVLLRLWTKLHIVRAPGWEDCMLIPLSFGCNSMGLIEVFWTGTSVMSLVRQEFDHREGIYLDSITDKSIRLSLE